MQKIKLANSKEFFVENVLNIGGALEIIFSEGVTYKDVAECYDPYFDASVFSEDALRKFEIYSDNELQGTHLGYVETMSIEALKGQVSVKVKKEDETKTDVEILKTFAIPVIDEKASIAGMQAEFATQDIEFLANAVFEIDSKLLLLQEQLPDSKIELFSDNLGGNHMAEMWKRWIQTGRRTFEQCPKQYQDEVRKLLADIGLDENGKLLDK